MAPHEVKTNECIELVTYFVFVICSVYAIAFSVLYVFLKYTLTEGVSEDPMRVYTKYVFVTTIEWETVTRLFSLR